MTISKAFYAYAGHKEDLVEDIRNAVKTINKSNTIQITTWQDLKISGKYIIEGIHKSIEECDLFICDLTYLNFNVLYELGYAISKDKKIWITLNESHPKSTLNYKKFNFLTTVGYSGYVNSDQLVKNFFNDKPYLNPMKININGGETESSKYLMYLKCDVNTTSSMRVSTAIKDSKIPYKVDDSYEGSQPLNWYLDLLSNTLGVVIHFHTRDSEEENPLVTARKAFVAGLSIGMEINTLLLAHKPFRAPLDYQDRIKIHSSAEECERYFIEWFSPIKSTLKTSEEDFDEYKSEQKALNKFSSLMVGDYVAENENQDLIEYFLETAEYREALNSQQVLFVGRKGTGKTANLIKVRNELSNDKRNFIISIQPQGYEFEGVLRVLKNLESDSEQGHLIESIWKYLIYTEMAKQYFDYLDNLPLHYQKSDQQENFYQYVIKNKRFINADFSLRLENIIDNLNGLKSSESLEEQRLKVSEYLHGTLIKELRNHLGGVLSDKEKITILIDNLDKGWNDHAEIEKLSIMLFGLLNVTHKITDEFHKKSYKHQKINLSLIVFIRSDIFSRVMSHASERDKIPTMYLSWNEPQLLFRVIENRIQYSKYGVTSPDALWKQYFCSEVEGVPVKTFISNLILPRPRDIIYLIKSALQEAVNRGHSKVEEEDFKSAEHSYSEYALHSLFPENGGRIDDLESILYEFAGEESIISQEDLESCLKRSSNDEIDKLIDILCEITFLGKEIRENKFEYYSEKRPRKVTDRLAERYADKKSSSIRYQINSAFHSYLGIEK